MTVANYNVRPRTTIHKELHGVLKNDAEGRGLAVSEMIALLIETHYVKNSLYQPRSSNWKRKLAAQSD